MGISDNIFVVYFSIESLFFFVFSGRSKWRSPGNSGLGVFKLKYFTHSVAVSWEFFYLSTTRLQSETWILSYYEPKRIILSVCENIKMCNLM